MADRIVVLRDGEMRETGATGALLEAPRNDYTRSLLAAVKPTPRAGPATPASSAVPILTMSGIDAGYGGVAADGRPRIPVLAGIDVEIARGSTLGVIGESGSGKSTLARVAAGLLPAARGEIRLAGEILPGSVAARSREQLRRVQIVFQSADTALNPARTVGRILGRPLQFYRDMTGAGMEAEIRRLLDMVKLPAAIADRHPGELSGGQKQRVNFARALAADPEIILCDEITSALDTVVAAAILDLLAELRQALGVAYMFISHDLSTVRAICDRIMILYAGRLVESGPRDAVLARPRHPYTDLLISSVPELRTGWLDGLGARAVGEAAAAGRAPAIVSGCAFFERCGVAVAGICDREPPPRRRHAKGALVACHRDAADLAAAQCIDPLDIGAVAPPKSSRPEVSPP
jgi:peptide/nickel transport system ATP-binding protein